MTSEVRKTWPWWDTGQPVWKSRPAKWAGGTRLMWWDEPWKFMHWSTRLAAVLLLSSSVGVVVFLVWCGLTVPEDPPPPCSDYADFRVSEVPARCLSYFKDSR